MERNLGPAITYFHLLESVSAPEGTSIGRDHDSILKNLDIACVNFGSIEFLRPCCYEEEIYQTNVF